jgi:deoxyribose-phosphate aldolase
MTHTPAPAPSPFSPVEAARLALHCLDLTSLREDDDATSITALAARADTPHGAPAALCVYPAWLGTARSALAARGLGSVRLATVVNFPHGTAAAGTVVDEVAQALAAGADEIDVVYPWRALRDGDARAGEQLLAAVRRACEAGGRPLPLKVILETGELVEPALIRTACRAALAAGADFLKTSTGKTQHHASPQAVTLMLEAIVADGRRAGLKVSGGVADLAQVQVYLALAAAAYGADALSPRTLRFGASSLLPRLLAVLDGESAAPPDTAAGARY